MFMDANATHIALTIEGIATDLQVMSFEGRETLNKPCRFDIELVSESPDLDLEALINQPCYLTFDPAGKCVHGRALVIDVVERLVGRLGRK